MKGCEHTLSNLEFVGYRWGKYTTRCKACGKLYLIDEQKLTIEPYSSGASGLAVATGADLDRIAHDFLGVAPRPAGETDAEMRDRLIREFVSHRASTAHTLSEEAIAVCRKHDADAQITVQDRAGLLMHTFTIHGVALNLWQRLELRNRLDQLRPIGAKISINVARKR